MKRIWILYLLLLSFVKAYAGPPYIHSSAEFGGGKTKFHIAMSTAFNVGDSNHIPPLSLFIQQDDNILVLNMYYNVSNCLIYTSFPWSWRIDTVDMQQVVQKTTDSVLLRRYTISGSDTLLERERQVDVIDVHPLKVEDISFNAIVTYPNPAHDQFTVEGAAVGSKVSLNNMLGQQVYSGRINNAKEVMDVAQLPDGNYVLQVIGEDCCRNTIKITKQ